MASIFLFTLIVGGGLLAVSLLGDLFGGGDVDLDTDVDVDVDVDVDPDGADVAGATRIFSIRNLTYFLFGFGATGWLLLEFGGVPVLVALAAAVAAGGVAAGLAAVVFGWLKATDSGWQPDEESFVGCEARVVLPVAHGQVGQIIVSRGHREHELRALPFDGDASAPERWRNVVVIEMEDGTARVSPIEALAPADPGHADQ